MGGRGPRCQAHAKELERKAEEDRIGYTDLAEAVERLEDRSEELYREILDTPTATYAGAVGLAAILVFTLVAKNSLEKKWKPADPD